jgi:outer membrane protein OmpA-like peptidoglycan-associated protein
MRHVLAIAGIVMMPAAFLNTTAAQAAVDCGELDGQVRSALEAGDTAQYAALHDQVTAEPSCDAAYRDQIGRAMARSMLTTLSTDSPPEVIEEKATRFGRPWQVLGALGDAWYDRREWASAVAVYEEALDDMRDEVANPRPPPEAVERRIYKRAVEARALAPTFVATRQFRGKKTGLADPNFRNFTAEAVPVPVQFETDSEVLTPIGLEAVGDIYAYLSVSAPDYAAIVGHTDPRGSDEYNFDLSYRRAESVAAHLTELGYTGQIEVFGLGESDPFVPDDPAKYSVEERLAFDRRVEYRFSAPE